MEIDVFTNNLYCIRTYFRIRNKNSELHNGLKDYKNAHAVNLYIRYYLAFLQPSNKIHVEHKIKTSLKIICNTFFKYYRLILQMSHSPKENWGAIWEAIGVLGTN